MNTAYFFSLDRTARVVGRNFWFTAQKFSGGRWRDLAKTRSLDSAVAIAVI